MYPKINHQDAYLVNEAYMSDIIYIIHIIQKFQHFSTNVAE